MATNEEEMMKAFWEWKPYLNRIGLEANRLQLMLDTVRMKTA